MRKWGLLCAVALLALAVLGVGIGAAAPSSTYSDPVLKLRAQDESIYMHCALAVLRTGDWLTPHFLDRPFLYKPPLLYWLSAASAKILGCGLLALRLPSLMAGAAACLLAFLWAEKARGRTAGLLAVTLLLSNPLWHTYSRICYADALTATACLAAMYCLARDGKLGTWRLQLGFGAATAAAILAKHVAGVLPLVALLVYCLLAGKERRPSWRAAGTATAVAAALALPWHLYQLAVHPKWFWMDYVQIQLFKIGLRPEPFFNSEPAPLFYFRLLLLTDPILLVFGLAALPALHWAVRRRGSPEMLALASWLLVSGAALCAFGSKHLPYIALLLPRLAVAGAACASVVRWQRALLVALVVAFAVKAFVPAQPWGLRFGAADAMPSTASLGWYSAQQRGNDLLLIDPDDEFYSAVLRPGGVRYLLIDPAGDVGRTAPHYVEMGIAVSVEQYLHLDRPAFRARQREWGADSPAAIATVVTGRSARDLLRVLDASPAADFYLPEAMLPLLSDAAKSTHEVVRVRGDRCFLIAKRA